MGDGWEDWLVLIRCLTEGGRCGGVEVPAGVVMPFVSLRMDKGSGVAVGLVNQYPGGGEQRERGDAGKQERHGQGQGEGAREFVCYIAKLA